MAKIPAAKPRFITPPNTLKIKVGHGGIPPERLKLGQREIESTQVDFGPYAEDLIKAVENKIKDLKKNPDLKTDKSFILQFADPIMGLKANGGMFKYPLISMVSDVCLRFIDQAGELNNDGLNIIYAHNKSVQLLLKAELKGYAGPEGNKIVQELEAACDRYFKKHKVS